MSHAIATTGYRLKRNNTSNSSLYNLGPGYIMSLRETSPHLVADVSNTTLVLVVTRSDLTTAK